VGYSTGALVINEWLNKNKELWQYISAVELYGDVLWHRHGPPFLGGDPDTYEGVLRRLVLKQALFLIGFSLWDDKNDPYMNGFPQGPKAPDGDTQGLSGRWQSRCRRGDALCGEGFGSQGLFDQIPAAFQCAPGNPQPCTHQTYHQGEDGGLKSTQYYPATKLTANGAHFLALKTFPDVFTKDFTYPWIAHVETFVEGVHVFFRLYYTDPSINGFGFVGADGSGWGEENHPFSSPSYGRVSSGRIDYPFNHLCGTPSAYESVVEAWMDSCATSIDNCTPISRPGVKIRMKCNAPTEVITPFFNN
jgi:hypothetical protein